MKPNYWKAWMRGRRFSSISMTDLIPAKSCSFLIIPAFRVCCGKCIVRRAKMQPSVAMTMRSYMGKSAAAIGFDRISYTLR